MPFTFNPFTGKMDAVKSTSTFITTRLNMELNFPFASLRINTTDASFPPITYVDLGTVEDNFRAFDGAAKEQAQGSFLVPQDIDTTGTVTFYVAGKRASGTAAANVVFDFDHRAVADAESLDGSYTNVTSGALAVDTTLANLDILSFTATVSTLGWAAGDLILFKIGRDGADALDTLNAVDYYGLNFMISIPRA